MGVNYSLPFRTVFLLLFYCLVTKIFGQCDALEHLESYHRNYQDDSVRYLSERMLEMQQENSFCYYYYKFFQFNSYLFSDYEMAVQIARSLEKTDEPKKEFMRLAVLQDLAYYDKAYRERIMILEQMNSLIEAEDLKNDEAFVRKWKRKIYRWNALTFNYIPIYDSAVLYAHRLIGLEGTNAHKADSYTVLGRIYAHSDDIVLAAEMYKKALRYAELESMTDMSRLIAQLLNNLGTSYEEMGKYDSSLLYLFKGLQIARKAKSTEPLISKLFNIGSTYESLNNYDSAARYYEEALNIASDLNFERRNETMHLIHYNSSELALKQSNHEESLSHARSALNYANSHKGKDLLMDSHLLLSKVYQVTGRLDLSLASLTRALQLREEVFSEEKVKAIEEIKTKYETEKKERQISTLAGENAIKDLQLDQQRIIILSAVLVAVLILIIGLVVINQNKLKASQKQLVLEQSLLRTQMNPHFIFNALSSIQSFIMKNDQLKAATYLSNFGELTRDILEASKQELILLSKEVQMIKNYVLLEEARINGSIQLELMFENLNPDEVMFPPMLIQPFLENAIKHGIRERTEGIISLRFSKKNDSLGVRICDDGGGFDLEDLQKTHSMALKITQNRLVNDHRKKQKKQFEIKNRVGENGEKCGVEVNFIVPLIYAV